jgi:hypothetical protein
LRYAMLLADALRKIHDGGKAHGAVTPSNIALTDAGLELLLPPGGSIGAITPYTAPEALPGRAPDARGDIFAFGAILFEVLAGRRAFEGEGRAALAANIDNAPAPASGIPAVDRLIGLCLTRNPDLRTPRIQRVMMELKLLSVAAQREEVAAAGTTRHEGAGTEAIRAEMQQMESRIAARLQAHEKAASEMRHFASEAVSSIRVQIAALSAAANSGTGLGDAAVGRMTQIERGVDEIRRHSAQFERSVADDLLDIEQSIKAQATAIESSCMAMSQTDDLVERVVEALESLQTAVLDERDPASERANFAVN